MNIKQRHDEVLFEKNIAWDYYDGPISGIVQQEGCGVTYRYQVVAWDELQDFRLFALSKIPENVFERIEMSLKESDVLPKYPIWFIDFSAVNEVVKTMINDICRLPFRASMYVVGRSLVEKILMSEFDADSARIVQDLVTQNEIQDISLWKEKLGINIINR